MNKIAHLGKKLKHHNSPGLRLQLVFLLGVFVGATGLMIALKLLFPPAPPQTTYRSAPPYYAPGGSFRMYPPVPPSLPSGSTPSTSPSGEKK